MGLIVHYETLWDSLYTMEPYGTHCTLWNPMGLIVHYGTLWDSLYPMEPYGSHCTLLLRESLYLKGLITCYTRYVH